MTRPVGDKPIVIKLPSKKAPEQLELPELTHGRIVGVPSSVDKDMVYRVDLVTGKCSCVGFKFNRKCKHLEIARNKGKEPVQEEIIPRESTPMRRGLASTQIETVDDLDAILLTRLSKNFILRDFWYTSRETMTGMPNLPRDWDRVIRAGKQLCEKVCEPILAEFGRFAITFGYQSHKLLQDRKPNASPNDSNPHEWDRMTRPNEVYARIDILPFCVEDGDVTKEQFGQWVMNNLDVDLLMQWQKSNIFCITISERQRRVWMEWGARGSYPNPRSTSQTFMGEEYWTSIFPTLSNQDKPKFYPSTTNGRMW